MMNVVEPIKRVYCQKILPLVYDDSLSYYEAICRLVAKMNEIIESINNGLREAIDSYFNTVMIDAIYDEETETITLKKELIVGDGVHRYDGDTNSMIIGD